MQELLDLVVFYTRAIWTKRWHALAVAWFMCIVGWALVWQLPDQYKATARVNIDTQSFLKPLLRGLAFATSSERQVQLMVSTLLSRPNIEKIARMTDLDLTATTDQDMDELAESLKSRISLAKVDRQQDLYTVSYVDEDRDLAKKVVQAVLTVFVENTLGENREESVTAKRFLDAEIKDYEERLKAAEQKLVDFKRRNIGYLSASGSDFYQRLQGAMGEVESAKLNLTEALKQRDSIQEQIEDEEDREESSLLDFGATDGSSTYDARIGTLQARLDEMFLKYTDQHPDVITLKSQLADLVAKREEELAQKVDSGQTENPVLQSLKLNLGQAEAQVAALKARVDAYNKRVEDLQKQVHTIPAVEAELQDLNRDYDVVKRKHNELLTRREQANISQKASQASDDIEFKVIDPTRVPFEPSGPPRILFMTAVLVAGMLLGVGFALFLVLIKPTFASTKMLGIKTGVPVLGTVSFVSTGAVRAVNRRRLLLFMGLAFSLLVIYSSMLLFQLLSASNVPPVPL